MPGGTAIPAGTCSSTTTTLLCGGQAKEEAYRVYVEKGIGMASKKRQNRNLHTERNVIEGMCD
jgi:hypothetical protein